MQSIKEPQDQGLERALQERQAAQGPTEGGAGVSSTGRAQGRLETGTPATHRTGNPGTWQRVETSEKILEALRNQDELGGGYQGRKSPGRLPGFGLETWA